MFVPSKNNLQNELKKPTNSEETPILSRKKFNICEKAFSFSVETTLKKLLDLPWPKKQFISLDKSCYFAKKNTVK